MFPVQNIQKLAKAMTQDNFSEVLTIFLDPRFDINQQGRCLWSPLQLAAEQGKIDFVRLFLLMGANPNHQNSSSHTALTIACEKGYQDIVEVLLRHPTTRSKTAFRKRDKTEWMYAKKSKSPRLGQLLTGYGIWPKKKSEMPSSASTSLENLVIANIHAFPEIRSRYENREANTIPPHLEEKIEHDISSQVDDEKFITAIEENKPVDLFNLLMAGYVFSDKATEMKDDCYSSFLGYAARQGNLLLVKLLVAFAGSILSQGAENYTYINAHEIARRQSHNEVADYLGAVKLNQHFLFREYLSAKDKGPEAVAEFFDAAEQQQIEMFNNIIQEVEEQAASANENPQIQP